MKRFADIEIGKKLGLVLGGGLFLLAGLSGLSLWGFHANGKLEDDSLDRMTKCLLSEQISRAVSEARARVRAIAYSKKITEQDKAGVLEKRKEFLGALDEFKSRANTAKSKQHAAEMAQIAEEFIGYTTRIFELVESGHQADAARIFETKSTPLFEKMKDKAAEAKAWQMQLVDEN